MKPWDKVSKKCTTEEVIVQHEYYGNIHIPKGETYFEDDEGAVLIGYRRSFNPPIGMDDNNLIVCTPFTRSIDRLYDNVSDLSYSQSVGFLKGYEDMVQRGAIIEYKNPTYNRCYCDNPLEKIKTIKKKADFVVQTYIDIFSIIDNMKHSKELDTLKDLLKSFFDNK